MRLRQTRFSYFIACMTIFCLPLACARMGDSETTDYGPAVDTQIKNKVIAKSQSSRSIYDIKAGEWIISQVTQRIFTGAHTLTGIVAMGVSSIQDDDQYRTIRLVVRNIQFDAVTHKPIEDRFLDKIVIPRTHQSPALSSESLLAKYLKAQTQHAKSNAIADLTGVVPSPNNAAVVPSRETAAEAAYSYCQFDSTPQPVPAGFRLSVHNLNSVNSTLPPPRLVQSQTEPVCEGLNPCELKSRIVHYDEVLWNNGGADHQRYHCSFQFSDDAPFLAGTMKRCLYFVYVSQKHKAPVEICSSVADFQFGSDQLNDPISFSPSARKGERLSKGAFQKMTSHFSGSTF